MRILFFGTSEFALPSLRALAAAGHEIAAIVTQPDRPRGRSGTPAPPPVKEEALRLGLSAPILQPERLKTRAVREAIEAAGPFERGIVVSYGQLIPRRILCLPRLGFLNVHGSLLPRWRGAAPVQRAIEAGDRETGVTIMRVTERLDAGPVLASRATPIGENEGADALFGRLAALGASLLEETLARPDLPEIPQDEAAATYARPVAKEEGRIDWGAPPDLICRRIRAFRPWPGAFSFLSRKKGGPALRVEILAARPAAVPAGAAAGPPGLVLGCDRETGALLVRAGEAALAIERLKPSGKREMTAEEWLRGRGAEAGDRFGADRLEAGRGA
jgi:methionyl-tRNA formyltransferase